MPTLGEIVGAAGPKEQEAVVQADKRWRQKVQDAIRDVTRLKFDTDTSGQRVAVPIKIADGYPDALLGILNEPISETEWIAEQIAAFTRQINALRTAAGDLGPLTRKIPPLENDAIREDLIDTLNAVESTCRDLFERAKRAQLRERLMSIREDILGVYSFLDRYGVYTNTEIRLFWKVIGTVAGSIMDITVEELTVLVMAHELAHAYSHVACDAAGSIWARGFPGSAIEVTEGIAQYYTWAVARYLDEHHFSSFLPAYEKKISHQQGPYRVHEKWVKEYSPEVFRQALIEARAHKRSVTIETFEAILAQTKGRLAREA